MIDTSWVRPPFEIVRIAHLELVVRDLGAAREFYVDLLGLPVTEETADAIYLRGYEERVHHSLVLRRGAEPLLGHVAFRVWEEGDLDALAAHFEALGCTPAWAEPGQVELGQGRALRVQDPLGFPVEFFHETSQAERLLQRFDLYRGAQIMRLEHVNLYVPDPAPAYEVYRGLGFRCSEYIAMDDGRLAAVWLYRKPTVHDVAFTTGAGPRLHHIAFAVSDPLAIMRLCDILAGARRDGAIERGPGRHGVSNAFFVYLRDPDGHRVELYVGDYYTGDPDFEPIGWSASDPRRRTFWGHAVPDCWYEEGTQVADLAGGAVALEPPVLDERVGAVH
jgi:3,4-dihydroxyphenylacetate 2,3-dioxygenase